MQINKLVQNLNEAVKRRQGTFFKKGPSAFSPNFPFKLDRKQVRDLARKQRTKKISEPFYSLKPKQHPVIDSLHQFIKPIEGSDKMAVRRKFYRGTIRGASAAKYTFLPKITNAYRAGIDITKVRGPSYSEEGDHDYSFKTKSGQSGTVHIRHGKANKRLQRKGIMTTSAISFDIDGSHEKTGEQGHNALSIFRTVLPSIRHHIKSLRPDQIQFTSVTDPMELQRPSKVSTTKKPRDTRKDLYSFLVKKLSRTYDTKTQSKRKSQAHMTDGSSVTNFTLVRKKPNIASLQAALALKEGVGEGLDQHEWDEHFDRMMDKGDLSAEQIRQRIGSRPLVPHSFWNLSNKQKGEYIRANILRKDVVKKSKP
jgi:hypothetical protein